MNERIEELESQAWEQVNRTSGLVRTEDFNQKFADLILEDVLDIVGAGGEFCSRPKLVEQIQTHFGVEE
jgi:hypothetical protein